MQEPQRGVSAGTFKSGSLPPGPCRQTPRPELRHAPSVRAASRENATGPARGSESSGSPCLSASARSRGKIVTLDECQGCIVASTMSWRASLRAFSDLGLFPHDQVIIRDDERAAGK